jgi:hypothetical protein
LVAAGGTADGGDAATHLPGQVADALALGQAQQDAGAAHLEPGRDLAAGQAFEGGDIGRPQGNGQRLAPTHGADPSADGQGFCQHSGSGNFDHDFRPATLGVWSCLSSC